MAWDLDQTFDLPWGLVMTLTGLAASITVNTLVTGMIVFKILRVFLEVKAISAGGTKLRQIIFIIIESGMALFAIQLVRVVLTSLLALRGIESYSSIALPIGLVVAIHQMLNVIIRSASFVLLIKLTWLGHRTNNNLGAGRNETVIR